MANLKSTTSPSASLDTLLEVSKILFGWCCVPILLFVTGFFIVWKCFVTQLAKIIHPDLIPISTQDTGFTLDKITEQDNVNHEHDRVPLNVIGFYIKLSGEVKTDLDELKQRMMELVVDIKSDYSWKLKSYLVRFCDYNFWKKCSNFNIDNHIRKSCLKSGENIDDFLSDWSRNPFAPLTPLWELLVVDIGPQEYIAFKIHHALGDGLSIFEMMTPHLSAQHHPRVVEIVSSPTPRISTFEKVKLITRLPWLMLSWLFLVVQTPDPFRSLSKPADFNDQSGQWVSLYRMKLSDMKSVSKKQKTAFITVLMCVYAGAIRRLLEAKGSPVPKFLVIPVPQPWPGRPKNFIGNSWSVIYVPIPISTSDPLERLDELQSNIADYYTSGSFFMFKFIMMYVLSTLPNTIHSWFRNFVCVRYSLTPILTADAYNLYDGRKLESIQGLVGLVHKTFKIMAVTISHNEEFTWSITGTRDIFKTQADLDLLTQKYIPAEVDELQQAIRTDQSKTD